MKLIVVESPKKARTIGGFLGTGYRIAASMGHVRDLPPKALGIDVERDFAPHYEILPKARKALAALRRAAAGAESVLLATDPDREGEAIAWHLVQALRLPKSRYRRITFHEISRPAIQEALAHPRDLDPHLIDAQQARRVLDRLVGYRLSPLLWRKVQRGTSAGRVQSVAVRLVVDREREIAAFVPEEYWTIDVRLSPVLTPPAGEGDETGSESFLAHLQEVDGKPAEIKDEATARLLEAQLRVASYQVRETEQKTPTRHPWLPFTTSTLQQVASNRLRFPAKKTMALAQALYEAGLVTYMRTDSVAVSTAAVAQARRLIAAEFGPSYVPPTPPRYRTKTRNAQEAHEAIRPVDLLKMPAALRASLAPDEWRLYDLIWKRMIASQMAPARYRQDVAWIDGVYQPPQAAAGHTQHFTLKAQATALIFPGWLAAYGEETSPSDDVPANERLPQLTAGDPLRVEDVLPARHFTQPPRRYTEASLVKALEEAGVGRPSTYATVVSTIQERGYVRLEQRHFLPTELGYAANDFLVAHFPRIVDLPFTAEMEDSLDEIAGGRLPWTEMLHRFYGPFSGTVAHARSAGVAECFMPAGAAAGEAGAPSLPQHPAGGTGAGAAQVKGYERAASVPAATCPQCGKPLIPRVSQFGPFLGCSGYPVCRYIHRSPGSLGRLSRVSRANAAGAASSTANNTRRAPPPLTERVIRARKGKGRRPSAGP